MEKYRELGQGEEWELGVLGGVWGGERDLCWASGYYWDENDVLG